MSGGGAQLPPPPLLTTRAIRRRARRVVSSLDPDAPDASRRLPTPPDASRRLPTPFDASRRLPTPLARHALPVRPARRDARQHARQPDRLRDDRVPELPDRAQDVPQQGPLRAARDVLEHQLRVAVLHAVRVGRAAVLRARRPLRLRRQGCRRSLWSARRHPRDLTAALRRLRGWRRAERRERERERESRARKDGPSDSHPHSSLRFLASLNATSRSRRHHTTPRRSRRALRLKRTQPIAGPAARGRLRGLAVRRHVALAQEQHGRVQRDGARRGDARDARRRAREQRRRERVRRSSCARRVCVACARAFARCVRTIVPCADRALL